ncbi:TlpA family protein disulfide reductase [Methylomicrobium lacus]|uniref:TlpA family protein disulfide reductase n=1 Tax=Methylomicrobium lacus TaxID=136992 RepID=UPI00045EB542|nr:TlpA disulfide reductase family protein [Methylomicrobium lacus]
MKIGPWLLLAFVALALLSACGKKGSLQIGDTVPTVTLADLQGKPFTLPKDVRGKVVLIRFWAIDCGFCEKEKLFTLERFYQKYKDRSFLPVAVNVSPVEKNDARFEPFRQLTYPLLVDQYGAAAKQFGVKFLPATVVIDEEGILRGKISGEAEADALEKLFTTVLNKGGFYESGN